MNLLAFRKKERREAALTAFYKGAETMDLTTIANRLNSFMPYFLRNHGRCTGGAYKPKNSYGERFDATHKGDVFDGKRALLRKDWKAAQRALENCIDYNSSGAGQVAVLCDTFDKGDMALHLVQYAEKRYPAESFLSTRAILASAHTRHYKTCHRKRDARLAEAFAAPYSALPPGTFLGPTRRS